MNEAPKRGRPLDPNSIRARMEARRKERKARNALPPPVMRKGLRQVRDYIEARKGIGKEAETKKEVMSEVALKLARLCARRNLLPADCAWMR